MKSSHHSVTRVRRQGNCAHPYEPDEPSGYVAWHEWAEEKAKTHEQRQCPNCKLWVIWSRACPRYVEPTVRPEWVYEMNPDEEAQAFAEPEYEPGRREPSRRDDG